jgi:hypothetical protein
MINKLTLIIALLLLVSCQKNGIGKPKKPDNLIPKNKMVEIIYDMSLITVAKGVNKRLLEENGLNPEEYVYNKYNIDSIQFVESNNYYAYHLEDYNNIYSQVKDRLTKEKAMYNDLIMREKKEKDSLKALRMNKIDTTVKSKKRGKMSAKKSPLKKVDSSRVSTRQ